MIRAASEVPVIVITARDDDATIVRALDARRRRLRREAVRSRPGRGADPRGAPPRRRPPARTSRSGSATSSSTRARAPPRSPAEPLELARKEFDLLLALAQRPGEVVTKRELLAEVWRQPYGGSRPDRRRPPVVAAAQARRDRGRAALPDQRPRRRACGWSTRDAGLMRRRISWLVLATTSAIVMAFVIPLCLLVRTLADDRAMSARRPSRAQRRSWS